MTVGNIPLWAAVPLSSQGGQTDALALLGVGFLIGLVFIYVGAKKWRLGRRIRNTATERIRSVAVGRTEVTGVCRDAGITYEKPYADGECIYRKWQVEEYRPSTGSSDDDAEWVVVDGNTDVAPFFVEDDTGQMLVDTTDAPAFEISSENSYTTTIDRGEEPPPEVESFSPESPGLLETAAGNVDPGKAISKIPGMGGAEQMFGGHTISEMMAAGDDPEKLQTDENARQQFMQQYFDEDLLDEDGQLREDVTEEEFMAAMGDDTGAMNPADMFGEMFESASGSAPDGDGQPGQESGAGEREEASSTTQQGPPEVVQELGGTGSAGTLGTGSSLGGAIVEGLLHRVSGGRLGSPSGGFLGSGDNRGRYRKRRYTHEVLPVDHEVYVFGAATPRGGATRGEWGVDANADRLKLGEEELTGQFVVADRDEASIIKHFSRRGPLYIGIGLVVSAGSLAGLLVTLGLG